MQPRRNLRIAAKAAQIAERRQKRLLRRVASVLLAAQHPVGKREDAAFPAAHNFAESLRITRERALHHLFVVRDRFHLADVASGRGVQMFGAKPRAVNSLDAPVYLRVCKKIAARTQISSFERVRARFSRLNFSISIIKSWPNLLTPAFRTD